jgi:hypothetical protein
MFRQHEALSFREKPRQLSHVSCVVKDSVDRASQVIAQPLDDGLPVPMPLKPGWQSSWPSFVLAGVSPVRGHLHV